MQSTTGMNRRRFLMTASVAAFGAGCDDLSPSVPLAADDGTGTTSSFVGRAERAPRALPTAAVSLGRLQEDLASPNSRSRSGSKIPAVPLLSRLTGHFVDGSDVIVFGERDPALPAIEIDTLAVSLRNAYVSDPVYEGIPGCTIDPIPGDDPWKMQRVRTFGLGASRVARRWVDLDYELKLAGAQISVDERRHLPSVMALAASSDPCNESTRPVEVAHRFWFFPDTPPAPRFERLGEGALIRVPTGVRLLTEQEFLNNRGERTGATDATPQALNFAEDVTSLLRAGEIDRYAALVSDFRVIEATKLMRFCGVSPELLSTLLFDYPVTEAPIPNYVGGVEQEIERRTVCDAQVTPTSDGLQYTARVSTARYEYRGGVEARVELSSTDMGTDGARVMAPIVDRVLSSRPSPGALSWGVA